MVNIVKISIFSSGSAGNCALIQTKNVNILIDAGISKKLIEENLARLGLGLSDIHMLLITHEHADHIRAFNSIVKYENIKIFLSHGTYDYLLNDNKNKNEKLYDLMLKRAENQSIILLNRLENTILYNDIIFDNLIINVLPTFHDASESVGFVINGYDKKIVYITDTGYVHQELYEVIGNANAYILESNHDPSILMHSNRPHHLKMRILSNHGHLSNEDSMVTLAHVIGNKTKLVMHAHISQECNLSQIVEMTRKKVLGDFGIDTEGVEFVITSPFPSLEYSI
ncbi:MAG: MBL fold metallo-hydrolase [Erysipelotrichaceae bacterium]|nr:MBL fold metallo-hydrolase [Erysipelotrichaceae bacterium]